MSSVFATNNTYSVGSVLGASTNAGKTSPGTTPATSFSDVLADTSGDAAATFMKYQNMTMAEKIRASYLAAHKLTEEDLQKMTPEERTKIEKEIAQSIKDKIKHGTGVSLLDNTSAAS